MLHYYIGPNTDSDISLAILDGKGDVVTDLPAPGEEGIHRTTWDLRYEASETPRMRTKVLEHFHVEIGDDGWRPAGENGRVVPLSPPGEYTVRLTVGDRSDTQSFQVLKDPRLSTTVAEF